MERVLKCIGAGFVLAVAAVVFGFVFPPLVPIVALGFFPIWGAGALFAYWNIIKD